MVEHMRKKERRDRDHYNMQDTGLCGYKEMHKQIYVLCYKPEGRGFDSR
jgi:hypothetical protein